MDEKKYSTKKKRRRTIQEDDEQESTTLIMTTSKSSMSNPFATDESLFQENTLIDSVQAEAEEQISSPIKTTTTITSSSSTKHRTKQPRPNHFDSDDEDYQPHKSSPKKSNSVKKPNTTNNKPIEIFSQSQVDSISPNKSGYQTLFSEGLFCSHDLNHRYKIKKFDQTDSTTIRLSIQQNSEETKRVGITFSEALIYKNNPHVSLMIGKLSQNIFNEESPCKCYIFVEGSHPTLYSTLQDKFNNVRPVATYEGPDFSSLLSKIHEKTQRTLPSLLPSSSSTSSSSSSSMNSESTKKYNTRSGASYFSPSTPNVPTKEILNHYGISVTNKDLERLAPDEFLNDNLIDFYLKHLECYLVNHQQLKNEVVIFNTLFYPILGRNIERAQRIPSNNNIFDKTYVFIPINESAHWTLCVLLNPGAVIEKAILAAANKEQNSIPTPPKQRLFKHKSCLMIMDSLGGPATTHTSCVKRIRKYLNVRYKIEMEKQGKEDVPKVDFSKEVLPYMMAKVPGQNNSSDCGVFILQYVEMILKYKPTEFPITDQYWFDPNYISKKRERIKELIEAYKCRADEKDETKLEQMLQTLENDLENLVVKPKLTVIEKSKAEPINLDEEEDEEEVDSTSNENIVEDQDSQNDINGMDELNTTSTDYQDEISFKPRRLLLEEET